LCHRITPRADSIAVGLTVENPPAPPLTRSQRGPRLRLPRVEEPFGFLFPRKQVLLHLLPVARSHGPRRVASLPRCNNNSQTPTKGHPDDEGAIDTRSTHPLARRMPQRAICPLTSHFPLTSVRGARTRPRSSLRTARRPALSPTTPGQGNARETRRVKNKAQLRRHRQSRAELPLRSRLQRNLPVPPSLAQPSMPPPPPHLFRFPVFLPRPSTLLGLRGQDERARNLRHRLPTRKPRHRSIDPSFRTSLAKSRRLTFSSELTALKRRERVGRALLIFWQPTPVRFLLRCNQRRPRNQGRCQTASARTVAGHRSSETHQVASLLVNSTARPVDPWARLFLLRTKTAFVPLLVQLKNNRSRHRHPKRLLNKPTTPLARD
jgi:hypothetical protein